MLGPPGTRFARILSVFLSCRLADLDNSDRSAVLPHEGAAARSVGTQPLGTDPDRGLETLRWGFANPSTLRLRHLPWRAGNEPATLTGIP